MTESLSGSLSPGVVDNLLEYLKQTQASGRLRLYGEKDEGRIYLRSGAVTHTVWGRLVGGEALEQLLSWEEGRFEYEPEEPSSQEAASGRAVTWQEDGVADPVQVPPRPQTLPADLLEALSLSARRLLGPIGEIFLEDAAEDLGYDDDTAIMSKDAEALVEMMASYMDAQPARQFLSAARALLRQHGL